MASDGAKKVNTKGSDLQLKQSKAEAIARAAEELAWPVGTPEKKWRRFKGGGPTAAFKAAYKKYWNNFPNSPYEGVRKGCCCCHCARTVVRHALGNGFNKNLLPGNTSGDASLNKYMKKFGFTRFTVSASKGLSQLQRGDVLYYRKKDRSKGGHVWIYVGNKICAEAGRVSGRALYLHKISSSKLKTSDKLVYYGFRNTGAVSTSSSGSIAAEDSGEGINLHETIASLYSSEAYNFNMPAAAGEESESTKKVRAYSTDIKNYLDNIQYNLDVPSVTGAVPEYVMSSESFKSAKFQENKPYLMAQKAAGNLLSYPNFVEAPSIILDFNGIQIGGFDNRGDVYPNYLKSMSVNKINGKINQYVFNLSYQVRFNEDPNFIDKLISRTGYTKPLRILYGDAINPSLLFREENAVITDARRNIDAGSLTINYTISAISSNKSLATTYKSFPRRIAKPSTLIYELLYESGEISRELQAAFPGMRDRDKVLANGLIPTSDAELEIGGVQDISPDEYLNYLVGSMQSTANTNSTFFISYQSDNNNEFGGYYFRISEVISYNNVESAIVDNNIISESLYELNVGYPGDNFITDFKVCNNDYWPLIYKYSSGIDRYEYGIDADGNSTQRKVDGLLISDRFMESSVVDTNWWKQVTEFPITAKVTLKGLIKPVMLMTYIRVNTLFFGQRDIASGIYVVTAQADSISGSGCSTELTMLRVAGDNIDVKLSEVNEVSV